MISLKWKGKHFKDVITEMKGRTLLRWNEEKKNICTYVDITLFYRFQNIKTLAVHSWISLFIKQRKHYVGVPV